ncbi:pirin family protein [Alphaproteobacteria bacterium]|nr:pirin family protein [Alphaproteobacteria bacterium]
MRKVLDIIESIKTYEGDGIPVTRAFPIPSIKQKDPFLLFDHFGPIHYKPGGATGVPAHPHCGFEAITYLLDGEIEHKDSWGGHSSIQKGDVQWMTTGSGLIHSELVTEKFKKNGGIMQGLQIWVNLPKKNKKVKPSYQHIRKQDIPIIDQGDGTTIKVLVGNINDISSIIHTYSPVSIFDIQVSQPNEINLTVSKNQIAMIYVIDGELKFAKENKKAINGQMIYFDQSSNEVQLTSISSSGSYLMLAGKPLEETIVSYGPFITNTESEMNQSILDYKNGEMGHKI